MKIIVAPDSFKGSLTALEAANAISEGIRVARPNAQIDEIPLADGGEGTVDALVISTNGQFVESAVTDPLGRAITAKYGILGDDKTVVIEMSAASGITLLKRSELDPLKTTTFGTGELILRALESGYRKFVIGIGGSATNDGGTGMAQALGAKFINDNDTEIKEKMCGKLLGEVVNVDTSKLHPAINKSTFKIASDVTNPLLGIKGCANVYAQQKGALPEEVKILEKNMTSFIEIAEIKYGKSVRNLAGAGAAGGLGAGALLFLNANIASGINILLKTCNFKERISDADLIITGEGKIDNQTLYGKVLTGVARMAAETRIPVLAIGGIVEDIAAITELGIVEIYSIKSPETTIDYAISNAYQLLKDKVFEIVSKRNW